MAMQKSVSESKDATTRALREQRRTAELEVALAETTYMKRLLKTLTEADEVVDTDRAGWDVVASAGRLTDMKDLTGPGVETDLATVRKKRDRKSTRLNSRHSQISCSVFCLEKRN